MWKRDGKNNRLRDDDNFTFLGKGADFNGVIQFDGTVRIDGRLEGEIHSKGTLIVGENAVIKGILSVADILRYYADLIPTLRELAGLTPEGGEPVADE